VFNKELLDLHIDCIRRTLKTFLFEQYSAHRAHY